MEGCPAIWDRWDVYLQREIIKKEVPMFEGAIIVFSLLILFIGFCVTPWWFIPALIVGGIIWAITHQDKYY